MGWKGGVVGGAIGYVIGLFFKSALAGLLTFKFPSLNEYLTNTFIPSSAVDVIRFFTVPLPFALLGAALGVLYFRTRIETRTPLQ